MKRGSRGWLAGLLLGAQALAWGASPARPADPDAEGVPGESRALTGRVVGTGPGLLYLQPEQGPVIPLRVTHATRLAGRRIPREQSVEAFLRQSLPPGTPVHATFDVRAHPDGTPENVASAVDTP
jgi:hypothetical protein